MKPIIFIGDSLKRLREFPEEAKQDAGYQLYRVQQGLIPNDSKPMPTIGVGVEELRIWENAGTYRVIYTVRMKEALYVLHSFQKKSQATSKQDLDIAKKRYMEIRRTRS